MKADYGNFGFYKIDIDYVRYLYSKDSQVFYKNTLAYQRKPHLGLITKLAHYIYCIPLTSAKERHLNWSNISEHNYVIYENVKMKEIHNNDIYKKIGQTDDCKKILSVLEIRKMIPVNENLCKYINFLNEEDSIYKNLLEKEYLFLKPYKNDILRKAETLYEKQISTGVIKDCYCNFKLLEDAYYDYIEKEAALTEE